MEWNTIKTANEAMKRVPIKGKQYAQVNDRVMAFRAICPNGSIESDVISLEDGMVVIKATVRDEENRILSTGLAYEKEGSSNINSTSFIENCETSAVGRALGFLGLGAEDGIASAEELVNAITQQAQAEKKIKKTEAKAIARMVEDLAADGKLDPAKVLEEYDIESFEEMNYGQYDDALRKLRKVERGK